MAEPVPAGSDVSAGTYRCTNCGNTIDVGSSQSLPPCPSCNNGEWQSVSGATASTTRTRTAARSYAAESRTGR
jgi:predicted  nucleic acid-binding Zn-ribbon protein